MTREVSKNKLNTVTDYNELLITTPNSMHADMTIAALNAGKAVYLEMPMATTLPDCDNPWGSSEAVPLNLYGRTSGG